MNDSPRHLPEALPWALFTACVAAALYALRAAPAPYLLDSTELVATTMALAVSHPPGHPAYHLSHGWILDVPFGTIALRLHLLSTLASALIAGLVPLAAARLGWTRTTGARALAALVGVALAFTNALLFQAIRGEVYAFHALIVCAAMTAVLQPIGAHGGVRNVALAAAMLGVGLGNHHYLIVFAFPAFLAATLAFTPRPQRLRAIGVGCVFGAAPLLAYAYLPLRGAARPAIGWGWPTSLEEIWWTLSAKAFQKSASAAVELDVAAGLTNVVGVLADQWSVALIPAAAGGVLLVLRDRRVALALGLLLAFNLLTQTLFAFDPLNPDVLGYFMASNWAIALGLAYALTAAVQSGDADREARPGRFAVVFAAAILCSAAVVHASANSHGRMDSLARVWSSDALRDEAWTHARPDALIVTTYYETGFNAWYGQAVEDRRPDITHVHRPHRTHGFGDAMLLAQAPELEPLLTPEPESGLLDGPELLRVAARRPVYVEPGEPLEPEVFGRLIPEGLLYEVAGQGLPAGDFPTELADAHMGRFARVSAKIEERADIQGTRNLLWASFNQARVLASAGRPALALRMLGVAEGIVPHDPNVRALADSLR